MGGDIITRWCDKATLASTDFAENKVPGPRSAIVATGATSERSTLTTKRKCSRHGPPVFNLTLPVADSHVPRSLPPAKFCSTRTDVAARRRLAGERVVIVAGVMCVVLFFPGCGTGRRGGGLGAENDGASATVPLRRAISTRTWYPSTRERRDLEHDRACGVGFGIRGRRDRQGRRDLGSVRVSATADRSASLRVALLTREYPPEVYGGAGVHVEYLARELLKHLDVSVFCFGKPRS